MPTPDFLVIGAQKSGTTSLHYDLDSHPCITVTRDKEASVLTSPKPHLSPDQWYSHQFPDTLEAGQLAGDVSTTYSMIDNYPEVIVNATSINAGLKIIYILRNPIERSISHHRHDNALGLCSADINKELLRRKDLVENSKYWKQLKPWISRFGQENCYILQFENYFESRQVEFDSLCRFLEVPPFTLPDPEVVHNHSEGKLVPTRRLSRVLQSRMYREVLRPMIPSTLRASSKVALLKSAPPKPPAPSIDSYQYLYSALSPEADAISRFTNGRVSWDLAQCLLDRGHNIESGQ